MNEITRICLIGGIVFLAHMLEGITGFGCTVIALPFIALLLGIKLTVPLLCVLGWSMSCYIVIRSWKSIQWKEFAFIAVCAGIGLPFGMKMFETMSPVGLGLLLGVFMIGVGVHGSIRTWRSRASVAAPEPPRKNWLMRIILFCGGVIHGAFGTGGPFVVIYASKALPEKSLFRVTLSLLWFSLNSWRMADWTIRGAWNAATWHVVGWMFPFMVVGVLIGDWLHHRVSEFWFRFSVYTILGFAGVVMLGNNLFKLLS